MKLSRNSLKASEEKLKSAEAFVNGAEPQSAPVETERRGRGKPRKSDELTKPVSVSLTKTDLKTLDDQFKRYNMLAYKLQLEDDKSLNRSDIVRIMANKLSAMSDDEFMAFIVD
ncbi:hypothetical protein [Photobacterium leiognathi]|uniref:hypothetical protein n=1 Tax=Photobacterium leiognathi TaxID=553611 RepID=UPI002980A427|nr:hypothetical protein [Photobacterium leiognathi]